MIQTGRLPGPTVIVEDKPFLDSKVLYHHLAKLVESGNIRDNSMNVTTLRSTNPDEWILPVFIFEISTLKALAMEDSQQAVGFSDFVVAVRTYGGQLTTQMACGMNLISKESSAISRPLQAALLQTGKQSDFCYRFMHSVLVWGVSDTSEIWSSARGRVKDHRWSVGPTPFGDLSTSLDLPQALVNVAKRNQILSLVSHVMQLVLAEYDFLVMLSPSGKLSVRTLLRIYFAMKEALVYALFEVRLFRSEKLFVGSVLEKRFEKFRYEEQSFSIQDFCVIDASGTRRIQSGLLLCKIQRTRFEYDAKTDRKALSFR